MLGKFKRSENNSSIVGEAIREYRGLAFEARMQIRSVDVPEANIIVAITRAEDLGFIGVKIKGHYRCSMTRNCSSEVTRLHSKLVVVSRNRRQKKMAATKRDELLYIRSIPDFDSFVKR